MRCWWALALFSLTACVPKHQETASSAEDQDGDGFLDDDCDDGDPEVHPDARELCDLVDNDCDGLVDEDAVDAVVTYSDDDGDGFGEESRRTLVCDPTGLVTIAGDCDDTNPTIHPGAPETDCTDDTDYNCDGSVAWADGDADGVAACEDCDDANPDRSPLLVEVCDPDDVDEDCSGAADDLDPGTDPVTMTTWYRDMDGDGWTSGLGVVLVQCEAAEGYASATGDCNDHDGTIHPGATEVCDDRDTDEDCDDVSDDDDPSTSVESYLTWYLDADGDGYGDAVRSARLCEAPDGYVSDGADCDDDDPNTHPAGDERCGGADEDCDGLLGDEDPSTVDLATWYEDVDGDGYGDTAAIATACEAPYGHVALAGDCDDRSSTVHPGAAEVCDDLNVDEDCDGSADDDDPGVSSSGKVRWYLDADGDGYGATTSASACDPLDGYTDNHDDCDDSRATVHPGAAETCATSYDDDCDGEDNELDAMACVDFAWDGDGDGYGLLETLCACEATEAYTVPGGGDVDCDDTRSTVNPGASEVCDALNVDEDCDGLADDGDPNTVAAGKTTAWPDVDGDGYGAESGGLPWCDVPTSWRSSHTDCDDASFDVNPDASEICNGVDDDCDGDTDPGCPTFGYEGDLTADFSSAGSTAAAGSITGPSEDAFFGWTMATGSFGLAVAAYHHEYSSSVEGVLYVYHEAPSGKSSAESFDARKYGSAAGGDYPFAVWTVEDADDDGHDELAALFRTAGGSYWTYFYQGESLAGTFAYSSLTWGSAYSKPGPVTGVGNVNESTSRGQIAIADPYNSSNMGRVYLYDGTSSGPSATFSLMGESSGDYAGSGLAGGAGNDTNGDGFDDIFVGASGYDGDGANVGVAYVVHSPVSSSGHLSGVYVQIVGTDNWYEIGQTVDAPGDMDGDGLADLIVGAPAFGEAGTDAGALFVFHDLDPDAGADESVEDCEVKILGENSYDRVGDTHTASGDVNGDGALDLLVGVASMNIGADDSAGAAVLFYGPLAGTYDLGAGEYSARFIGNSTNDYCGKAVSLWDYDLDGMDDIVLSCPKGDDGYAVDYGSLFFFPGQ